MDLVDCVEGLASPPRASHPLFGVSAAFKAKLGLFSILPSAFAGKVKPFDYCCAHVSTYISGLLSALVRPTSLINRYSSTS
jgi:hypothetical protein